MIEIELANGRGVTVIDDCDADLAEVSWSLTSGRYAGTRTSKRGPLIYLHRVIAQRIHGSIGSKNIDHINRNPLDNRRENIRLCTQSQNLMNARKRKDTSSRYKGVSWDNTHNYWIACIYKNGKREFLGTFHIERKAAEAYDEAAKLKFGEFANLNFD